jgi:hypothetical protein
VAAVQSLGVVRDLAGIVAARARDAALAARTWVLISESLTADGVSNGHADVGIAGAACREPDGAGRPGLLRHRMARGCPREQR